MPTDYATSNAPSSLTRPTPIQFKAQPTILKSASKFVQVDFTEIIQLGEVAKVAAKGFVNLPTSVIQLLIYVCWDAPSGITGAA